MPFSIGLQKVQTNLMKAYKRPQQYIFCHCQLGHVSPGLSLLVSVCVFMLPMLGLVDEHVQLTTMYHMRPIHQWYVHPCHMTSNHIPLLLPSLNNVLPAMALQNRVVRSIIGCPSYTSSRSGVCHRSPILHLILPSGLERRVVDVVLVLLLLLSGDIETNPGPVLSVDDLRVVMKELNDVRAKWYNIGVHLGVSVGALDAIEKQYSDPTDCLRRTITTWLKSSTPTWNNIVDALNVVDEVRLATDLQHTYCSTQDIAATHQHVPPVPVIPPAQAHTWMTPAPQSTVPFSQPPVFTSPYSVPPQPHPSHLLPWSAPYYHSPSTSYPVSTPSLPPPTSYPASTPSLPPPTSYPASTPSLPPPTSYPVSTPSLPPPPSGPASTATSLSAYSQLPHITPGPTPSSSYTQPVHLPANLPSDGVQSMSIQPDIAAGTCRFCSMYTEILLYCFYRGEFSLLQIFSKNPVSPPEEIFSFNFRIYNMSVDHAPLSSLS